ncbi:MAG: 50S ribosomal protein L32 [Clostridia bacterium]|nr:50S ribosomal protein L32 [Clostridia bacterium]
MAVPKGKTSKARRDTRRSAHWKLSLPGIVKCPRCQKMKLSHRVCKNCGYYDGRQVLKVEEDAKA